jgi:hypothetical protein
MNKINKKDFIRLSDYIEQKLKLGSITFLKSDAINDLKTTETAFMRASQRLLKKGVLVRPVSGFYVIVEIEYRDAGGPPPIHFIDKLMKYLNLPYYIGLLTAAKFHGATHQSVFETQVFTIKPHPFVRKKFVQICHQRPSEFTGLLKILPVSQRRKKPRHSVPQETK